MRKLLLTLLGISGVASADSTIQNPQIDAQAFLKAANEAARQRESHRLTEEDFLRMMSERGTIVLDARSRDKYDLLHIRGAVNLPFPDITVESLARLLPDKRARILIYCNNNFRNQQAAFPTKAPAASLNVPTYITLYSYGYRNVYELGPYLDAKQTRLPLVSTH